MNCRQAATDLLGMTREALEELLQNLGEPRYRARQLFAWLHRGTSLDMMTSLPKELRRQLAAIARAGTLQLAYQEAAEDGTVKFGFETNDRRLIETVLIPHRNRTTVCVSSQIGCAYGCAFCATGRQGFTRDLTTGEIVEQVIRVQTATRPQRVRNVVFMGMGEPLANFDAVVTAIRLLNSPDGLGIGARHIAVSTCGLPNSIQRLAEEKLQVGLAVSLHAATDEVRNQLVPINRKHPLAEVVNAARRFATMTGRKVAFEYVIVPEVNDTPAQARRLAELVRGMAAMVNLIPLNPADSSLRVDVDSAYRFAALLRKRGVEVMVRRSRGGEVLGACGQLRARHIKKASDERSPVRRSNALDSLGSVSDSPDMTEQKCEGGKGP